MYYTHSIEKGLTREDFQPSLSFGNRPLTALAQLLNRWIDDGRDPRDTFFDAACATLRTYFSRHDDLGVNVGDKLALFAPEVQKLILGSSTAGGFRTVRFDRQRHRSFGELTADRVSLREFEPGPVDLGLISDAASIASRSPSACNRQSSRLHVVTDPGLIDKILRIQAGLGGYDRPPVLLLVTSDTSYYVEATERNQPFVDGALFAMTLMYALEYAGVGTCPLTAMLWPRSEKKVRALLDLPKSEALVTFVAVGRQPALTRVPYSRRESVESIMTLHESGDR